MSFDRDNGGFAKRPKFPEASKIALLLDIYTVDGNARALHMAKTTLTKMAEGGIYDQIEGGFFRYTTDEQWQIPHFEKMLYTNAELIPLYVQLYQIDPNPLYKRVVEESIAQMDRYFDCEGLYCSASDADSDGEEGGYFIHGYDGVADALQASNFTAKEIEETLLYLGIEEDGNIDGDLSHTHITSASKPAKLQAVKEYLVSVRRSRKFPFVDQKIITSWNAMMIKALFEASKIDDKYRVQGEKKLKKLLALMSKDDTLYHQVITGAKPKQLGILEDYAFVIDALLSAHQATLDETYLTLADSFAKKAIALFYRDDRWYLSSDGIETVAGVDDRLYSSPLGTMMGNLYRLALLHEESKMQAILLKTFESYGKYINNVPSYMPRFMSAVLREKIGAIVIKSSIAKLQANQNKIAKINYPFVLLKASKGDKYLACKMGSCFADSDSLDKLIATIETSNFKQKQKKVWK